MIQTLNPSASPTTDEIMSRYRPIAPKPTELPNSAAGADNAAGLVIPEKFRQSPYLRNIWSHLQARPTRTRKRAARGSLPRNHPSTHVAAHSGNFTVFDFSGHNNNNNNTVAPVLEERNLLLQLQMPNSVISPRPVRPVVSTISVVGPVGEYAADAVVIQTAEEVEEAAEREALPVVISDRNNKVRMANSAYKELVGQPECPWLDMTLANLGKGKRIGGEVMINPPTTHPGMGNGFSCWVRIEWGREREKSGVHAFCNVVKLVCQSDYMFSWRFHTT